jgi:hypothetical protein
VQVPALTSQGFIFAAWGNADAGLPPITGTPWDASYHAVWHLSQTNELALDATSHGYHGTPENGLSQQEDGVIAGGFGFDATAGQYVELTDHVAAFAGLNEGTLEVLFNTAVPNQVGTFLAMSDSGDGSSEVRLILESTLVRYDFRDGNSSPSGEPGQVLSPAGLTDGQWHHAALSVGTGNQAVLYIDGEAVANDAEPFFGALTGADQLAMGRNVDSGGPQWLYSGRLDEMRVSSTVRSSNWVWAASMNQRSNATFQTTSNVQPPGESLFLFLPPDVTVGCNAGTTPAQTGQATAVDDCTHGLPAITFADTVVTGACPAARTIYRVWTGTNLCGDAQSSTQVIAVADTEPPALSVPPNLTIDCSDPSDPAHTGTPLTADNCGGEYGVDQAVRAVGGEVDTVHGQNIRAGHQEGRRTGNRVEPALDRHGIRGVLDRQGIPDENRGYVGGGDLLPIQVGAEAVVGLHAQLERRERAWIRHHEGNAHIDRGALPAHHRLHIQPNPWVVVALHVVAHPTEPGQPGAVVEGRGLPPIAQAPIPRYPCPAGG